MSMTMLQVAKDYRRRFGPVVPLKPRDKCPPHGLKWKDYAEDQDQITFGRGNFNIGVRLGGIIDFDFDSPESASLALHGFLTPTAIFGRSRKPASHWIYLIDDEAVVYQKFSDPDPKDGECQVLLELRTGEDMYTRFPPSVHENGEIVSWEREPDQPSRLLDASRTARHLAAACVLVRCWRPGRREELDAALTGALVRAGWSERDISDFICTIAIASNDEEANKRGRKTSAAMKASQENVRNRKSYGWPKLQELMGVRRASQVRAWLVDESVERESVDAVIDDINVKYALINMEGKERVLEMATNPLTGYRRANFKTVDDFCTKLANRRVIVDGKAQNSGRVWLSHPLRRELDGVAFVPYAPDKPVELPRHHNLFQGWYVEAKKGDCSLYLNHILNNACGGVRRGSLPMVHRDTGSGDSTARR